MPVRGDEAAPGELLEEVLYEVVHEVEVVAEVVRGTMEGYSIRMTFNPM